MSSTNSKILKLVKLSCGGHHYKTLHKLSKYTLDEIYTAIKSHPSTMGNFYEIVLKLHYFFRLHTHAGVLVNIDRGNRKEPTRLTSLSGIIGGGSGGGSVDLTHVDFAGDAVIGLTMKYKKKSTLSLGDLEFLAVKSTIDSTFESISTKYYGVVIRDKSQITHLYKTGELTDDVVVYDFSDMQKYWVDIGTFINSTTKTLHEIERDINNHQKIQITLRKEQVDGVNQAVKYFTNVGNDFLLNAKMRYGKIVTSYEIAKRLNCQTILVATFFPAVHPQWAFDAENFANYNDIRIVNGNAITNKSLDIKPRTKTEIVVVLVSYQDFKEVKNKTKWKKVKNHKWDMLISDEFHYGVESKQTTTLLDSIKYKRHLALSGTPLKALLRGTFTESNTYTWSYIDEQRAKLTGGAEYEWLPTMNMHMVNIPRTVQNDLLCYDNDESFTINKLLATESNSFIHEDSVIMFLDMLSGQKGFRKDLSPYQHGSTNCDGLRHTVWYMPDVDSTLAMESLLNKHTFFRRYNILSINSSKYAAKDVMHVVNHHTNQSSNDDCAGSITLAFKQLNTGSSIPKWSGVFMMNNTHSIETYMQTIFRSQSQNKHDFKRECHVFDFSPDRCLNVIYEYASLSDTGNAIESIREWLEFAPLLVHDDNKITNVDINEFIRRVAIAGSFSKSFGHQSGLNPNNITSDIREQIEHIWSSQSTIELNDVPSNNLLRGKNYITQTTKQSKVNTKDRQTKKDLAALRTVTQVVPWLIIFTGNKYDNISDIIMFCNDNTKLAFIERCGVNLDIFALLIKANIIDESVINKHILSFSHALVDNKREIMEDMIRDSASDYNVKTFGEIPTEHNTIIAMLRTLPADVWSNPNLKWIDPVCGSASFLVAVFDSLFIGLQERIPDDKKRANHILKTMLYGIDIRLSNVMLSKLRLKYGRFTPKNIVCGDVLSHDFWNMEFDIVLGHIPFTGTQQDKIVDRLMGRVKANGTSIHLLQHTDPDSAAVAHMNALSLKHVSSTLYNTWYNVENTPPRKNLSTTFESVIDGSPRFTKDSFSQIQYPLTTTHRTALSIFKKVTSHKADNFTLIDGVGIGSRSISAKNMIQCLDSSSDDWSNVRWKEHEDTHLNNMKIVLSKTGLPHPVFDDGSFGTTRNTFIIPVSSRLDGTKVIRLINSKLYLFMVLLVNHNHLYQKMCHYIHLPHVNVSARVTDTELYKIFKLTKHEIKFIDEFI